MALKKRQAKSSRKTSSAKLESNSRKASDPIAVKIDGIGPDDSDLIKLLDDTITFIRKAGGRVGAEPFTETGLMFERLDLNDVVSLRHRS